jgi:hypothetical protein
VENVYAVGVHLFQSCLRTEDKSVGVICYKIEFERECCSVKIWCESEYKGEGTPRKLATAISENSSQTELNMELNGAAQIEETATQLAED